MTGLRHSKRQIFLLLSKGEAGGGLSAISVLKLAGLHNYASEKQEIYYDCSPAGDQRDRARNGAKVVINWYSVHGLQKFL